MAENSNSSGKSNSAIDPIKGMQDFFESLQGDKKNENNEPIPINPIDGMINLGIDFLQGAKEKEKQVINNLKDGAQQLTESFTQNAQQIMNVVSDFVPLMKPPVEDGVYFISPANNAGLAFDVNGYSKDDNANLMVYGKKSANASDNGNQTFNIKLQKNGSYQIIACQSNKALTHKQGDSTLRQYSFNSDASQDWFIEMTGIEQFAIKNAASGLYLTVNRDAAPNQSIKLDNFGTEAQIFKFIRLEESKAPVENGVYFISPANNAAQAFDVHSYSSNDNAALIVYGKKSASASDNGNQTFNFQLQSNGSYRIVARHSNKAFTQLKGDSTLRQWSTKSDSSQEWIIEPANNGSFKIKNAATGGYMTVNEKAVPYDEVKLITAVKGVQEFKLIRI
ncbi:MAG: RICIN domain-containing protein [Clostridiales bacterium]|jgi:uncharacterized protein YhfF|nr:RICIN domain-containing protein [Clostridiales bacterium]